MRCVSDTASANRYAASKNRPKEEAVLRERRADPASREIQRVEIVQRVTL